MTFNADTVSQQLTSLEGKGKAIDAKKLSDVALFIEERKSENPLIIRNLNHFATLLNDYERASKLKEMKFHNMPVIFEPPQSDDAYKNSEKLVVALSKSLHGIQAALLDGVAFHIDYSYTKSAARPDFAQFVARDLKGRAYRLATASIVDFGDSTKHDMGHFESYPERSFNLYTLDEIEPDLPGEQGEEIKELLSRLCLTSEKMGIIREPEKTKDIWFCSAAGLTVTLDEDTSVKMTNKLPFMMGLCHPMLNAQIKKFNPDFPKKIRDALVKQPTFGKLKKCAAPLLETLTESPNSISYGEIIPKTLSAMKEAGIEIGAPCSKTLSDERNKQIIKAHENNFARSQSPHERLFNSALISSSLGAGFRFDTKPAYEHKKVNFYPTNVDDNTGLKRGKGENFTPRAPSRPRSNTTNISSDVILETFMELKDQALQPEQIAFLILSELDQQALPLTKDELKEVGGIVSGMRRVPASRIKTGAEWFASVIEQKIDQVNDANNKHIEKSNTEDLELDNKLSR
jgi:hypothetical protein